MHKVQKCPTRKIFFFYSFYIQGGALVLIIFCSAQAAGKVLISCFFENRSKSNWLAVAKSDFAFQQNRPVVWSMRFVPRQMSCGEKNMCGAKCYICHSRLASLGWRDSLWCINIHFVPFSDSVRCCFCVLFFYSRRKFACVRRVQTTDLRWAVSAGPQHWLAHCLFQVRWAMTGTTAGPPVGALTVHSVFNTMYELLRTALPAVANWQSLSSVSGTGLKPLTLNSWYAEKWLHLKVSF